MPLTITNQLLIQAAKKRGWTHKVIDEKTDLVMLYPGDDHDPILLRRAQTELSNAVGNYIANEKTATSALARFVGVLTPEEVRYTDEAKAEAFLHLHKNIVVKPTDGAHGDGVSVGLTDPKDLPKAITFAQSHGSGVILQKYYEGTDYRVLTIGGRFRAAAFRKPAFVTGDGIKTVQDLIEFKNQDPLRGKGHQSPLTTINFEEVADFIGSNSLTQIPKKGQEIQLLGTANLSRGGEAMDVTDQVHEDIRHMAENISKAAGLGVCGVDIRCLDIALPQAQSKPVLIELNVSPGLRMHHYPSVGTSREVSDIILEEIMRRRSSKELSVTSEVCNRHSYPV